MLGGFLHRRFTSASQDERRRSCRSRHTRPNDATTAAACRMSSLHHPASRSRLPCSIGDTSSDARLRDSRSRLSSSSGRSTSKSPNSCGNRPFLCSLLHNANMSLSVNSITDVVTLARIRNKASARIFCSFPDPRLPPDVNAPLVDIVTAILPSSLTASNLNSPPEDRGNFFSENFRSYLSGSHVPVSHRSTSR